MTPAASPVVGNDLLEHRRQCRFVDRFALTDRHCSSGFVAVSSGDDFLWIRDDSAVVKEDIDVCFRCQQGADVAVKHEVRLLGAFDGFDHLLVGGVNRGMHLAADGLLPIG